MAAALNLRVSCWRSMASFAAWLGSLRLASFRWKYSLTFNISYILGSFCSSGSGSHTSSSSLLLAISTQPFLASWMRLVWAWSMLWSSLMKTTSSSISFSIISRMQAFSLAQMPTRNRLFCSSVSIFSMRANCRLMFSSLQMPIGSLLLLDLPVIRSTMFFHPYANAFTIRSAIMSSFLASSLRLCSSLLRPTNAQTILGGFLRISMKLLNLGLSRKTLSSASRKSSPSSQQSLNFILSSLLRFWQSCLLNLSQFFCHQVTSRFLGTVMSINQSEIQVKQVIQQIGLAHAIHQNEQQHPTLKYDDPGGGILQCETAIYIWLDNINNMGIERKKVQVKKQKVKILTKRDKAHKRVLRVHKAVERKRKERVANKKKASLHRRRLAATDDNEVVEMAKPHEQPGNVSATEMGLLEILGFGPEESHADWDNALERKLKEIEDKSLDNPEVKRVYGEIGKIFNRYRSGKVPKAFKIIPNLERWREVLALTRPEEWTSQAMAQAVNIFASNFDPVRAEEFYRTWLVPAVRRDLGSNKKLNVHLYDALKKALYKTNAWFKGIMFELCDEGTLLREVKVVESLLSKMSIPVISASVAMLKLMELPPTSPTTHYLAALLNKHYTLPRRVLTRLTEYLLGFAGQEGEQSVAWQCLLLTLAKQYSQSLDEMSKAALVELAKAKHHKLITPEILKNLQ